MKKTLKKFRPALLVVLLVLTGCQQDDVYMHDSNTLSKGNARIITYEELKTMPKAITILENFKRKKRQKSVYNEYYDFTVDTTSIALFKIDNYHSLTFRVLRDSTYDDTTENLILNWEPYEDYKVYFAKYNLTAEEKEKIANDKYVDLKDKEFLTFLNYFTPSSILKSSGGAGEEEDIIVVNGKCYKLMPVRINSTYNSTGQLVESEWGTAWTPVPCPEGYLDNSFTEGSHPGSAGGPTHPPTFNTPYPISSLAPIGNIPGTGSSYGPINGTGSPYNPVYTKPRVDVSIAHPRECEKITDAISIGNYRVAGLQTLASLVTDPYEYGSGLDSSGNTTVFTAGSEIGIIPPPAGTTYTIVSHTHDAGKLSVFSFADLEAFAKLLKNNQISTGTFVATLSTEKGTHYVLTISNTTKFKEFFYSKLHFVQDLDLQYHNKYRNKFKNMKDLADKYYNSKTRLISENNSNNEIVLKTFLTFLKEADMGVALFETDATFQNFSQLSINRKGDIQRSNCN